MYFAPALRLVTGTGEWIRALGVNVGVITP